MNAHTVPCPHCGGEIRADAHFCRHCGSSDADGWKDESEGDWEDDFDYEQFVEDNFAGHSTRTSVRPFYRLVAVVLLLAFAYALLSALL